MATADKLTTVAENVPKVYHAGQMNVVENAECLRGSKTDTAMLLDDVSPVTHDMGVRVMRKNLFDVSQLKVGANAKSLTTTQNSFSFKNITKSQSSYVEFAIYLQVGTYYINGDVALSDGLNGGWALMSGNTYLINNSSCGTVNGKITITEAREYKLLFYCNYSSEAGTTATYSNIQLELGTTATAYTPYVSDLTAVKVSRCGKNILEYPYVETTLTRNGITFTDNGDGTITVNGTATADTQFRLQDTVVYPDNYNPFKYLIGKVIGINGSPDGSSKDTYAIQSIQIGAYGNTGFTIPNSNRYRFAIFIKSGITVSNLVFKPMIYLSGVTNRDYEFYNRTDYTPNADGVVNGVTSLYPNTTLLTNDPYGKVYIDCDYYKDIDKTFNGLTTSVALSGGE